MRTRPWARAAIGGSVGLAVSLLLGFVAEVFWFPVGIGIIVISGAVIAVARPIYAAIFTWTVSMFWFGVLVTVEVDSAGPTASAALVRNWGPLIAVWAAGMGVIGLAWLIQRRGWPSRGIMALLVPGIVVMLAGSFLWASVAHVPAHSMLIGVPNSTLWKIVLFPGIVSYLVGFVLGTRQRADPVHREQRGVTPA